MMQQIIEGLWPRQVASLAGQRDRTLYFVCKRCIDVILAGSLLFCLSPLLLLIAIFIKLDTSGTALFVQDRVGAKRRLKDGEIRWEISIFPCYKFRSMTHDA